MEESERRRIEDAKERERRHAMEELEAWKSTQKEPQAHAPPPPSSAPARSRVVGIEALDAQSGPTVRTSGPSANASDSSSPELAESNTGTADSPDTTRAALRATAGVAPAAASRDAKAIFTETSSSSTIVSPASVPNDTMQRKAKAKEKEKEKVVPPVRAAARIGISFTPRVFPTPSRESQAPQEEEVQLTRFCSSRAHTNPHTLFFIVFINVSDLEYFG